MVPYASTPSSLCKVLADGLSPMRYWHVVRAGGVHGIDTDPIAALRRRAAAAGLATASLGEVLCLGPV
jgi:hypothetical protein